jgi:hypothetical protein
MSTFAGSSIVIGWQQSAATTTITGDHKSFTFTPSINLINSTAGADANATYIAGVKDGTWTFNSNLQTGTASGGTSTFSTLAEGNLGTLWVYPEGSTAGKTCWRYPSIAQGAAFSFPYDNVVEATVNGQLNGARVEGTSSGTVCVAPA